MKPKVNPAFKVAQPLPVLAALPQLKTTGARPCRSAASAPPYGSGLDFPGMKLDEKSCNPAQEPPPGNLLCKNFAFTNLPQVV
ncbi:MAG: hypothetical protein ABSB84_06595 [Verrucomicrobiota bacterium]|jgi:hypothetical protein